MWKLRSFTRPDGTPIVKKWLKGATSELKAAFYLRMNALIKLPADGWDRPDVGQLRHGACKGLFEIVLYANKIRHRPIGYFSGKQEFTFLAFAEERGNTFDPPNICETAQERKSLIENEPIKEKKRVCDITLLERRTSGDAKK
jgi:hypothetical protein